MSTYRDPFYLEDMARRIGHDPREIAYYLEKLSNRMRALEEKVSQAPSLYTFVTTNYPEIVEQFERVQATKKRLGAKEKP
jgi:hypothetical protein